MPRSGSSCYLDSSAVVKLVVVEPETAALNGHLEARPVRLSSALVRTEVIRAVRPHGPDALQRAWAVLDRLDLLAVDRVVLDSAGMLDPSTLRSLDAIHLASALRLRTGELVTYDRRLAEAGRAVGLVSVTPR